FTALALGCAVVAFRSDELANVPLLVGLVLLSLLATSLILGWASLQQLVLARHCPDRTFAGETLPVTLTLKNRARFPAAGVLLSETLYESAPLEQRGAPSAESQR